MLRSKIVLADMKNSLIALFVCYAIVFFVPSLDAGRYFELRYGLDALINSTTWNVLLVLVLVMSAIKLLTRSVTTLEISLLGAGMFLILFNLVLVLAGSPSNFNYFGVLLLTSLAIFELDENIAAKTIALALILIAFTTLLTILDGYFGLGISPIVEIKYVDLATGRDELGITNSSLFGQSNAAGAAIAFCLLFVLLHISKQKSGFYLTVYIIGFITLLSTFAMGPITVSIVGLLLYWVLSKKHARFTSLIILFVALGGVIAYNYDLSSYLEYKGGSGSIKYERAMAFFEAVSSNPGMLIFGENIHRNPGDLGFYTESSFLDIWLNFGLTGAILLMLIAAFGFVKALKARNAFAVCVILLLFVLMFTQNSSLMPANIIIFLVILGKLCREQRLQTGIASDFSGAVARQP